MTVSHCKICEAAYEPTPRRVSHGYVVCPSCEYAVRKGRIPGLRERRRATQINFHDYYATVPEVGCWIWEGAWGAGGYGVVPLGRREHKIAAHRFSYQLAHGEIPAGMGVLHKCDTPPCVNPDHLFVGTTLDNMRDRWRKGRYLGVSQANRRRAGGAA